MINKTIAAISTPYSVGGIGIIRVSGDESARIVSKIFTGSIDKSHTIRYGFVFNPETGEKIDEVLVSYMKAPNSYTKEDVVEINCHSGTAVLSKILDLVLKNGARLAHNGEFTKRAFLNGRIDLTRAEAVIDVINSKTDYSRQNAVNQLTGRLYNDIRAFMDTVMLALANIEASIDYPEHVEDYEQATFLKTTIKRLISEASLLCETSNVGRIIKEGINTVIVGRTNVGKSSLLNYFAGFDRAIVTDIHGTTRDVLEESINLDGVLLRLSDTAGIRQTADLVEQIGIERARRAANEADLVLAVFDGSRKLEANELDIDTKGLKLALINKIDLPVRIETEAIYNTFGVDNVFFISLLNNDGLSELSNKIKAMFLKREVIERGVITNARQREALFCCINNLNIALNSISGGFPTDIASINLMEAYRNLCEITGDNIEDDLIGKIFSEFCLGK